MRQLFLDIQAKLTTDLSGTYPDIFIRMFNGQFDDIDQGEGGSKLYSFPFPCVFIEFITDSIQQMGGGYQIYDPLIVRAHIGHSQLDAGDGTIDQNLDALDLMQSVYKSLQKFNPVGCNHWVRIAEEQDKNHTNVYHGIQDFRTNYIDQDAKEPIGEQTTTPPTNLDLTVDYSQQPQLRTIP